MPRRTLEGLQSMQDPHQAEEQWVAWISREKLLCTDPSLLCHLSPHPRDGEGPSATRSENREVGTSKGGEALD